MAARRRLTVALVVTGEVAAEIDGMRRALGARALQRIAPHCTLVPPVNVREEELDGVLAHCRAAAARSSAIAVGLGPPGTFWPRTPVLYLEVDGDLTGMGAIRDDLASGPLAPPAGRAEQAFVPHVTLDQRIDPERLAHALAALGDYRREYCFERLTVLEQGSDHRWEPIADATLGKPHRGAPGSLDLEISVVDRVDPFTAAWAEELWARYSRAKYGEAVRPVTPWAIVARSDGALVAFADGEVRGSVCRLGRLVVSAEWRGRGVGSQLLRAVDRLGLERGSASVRLETLAGEGAEGFYSAHGFKAVATLPGWREGRDFVLMERGIFGAPDPVQAAGDQIENDVRNLFTAGSQGS